MKSIRYFFIFALLPLFSCGLEDYIYLDPVENASFTGASSAIITMPNNSSSYFRYYTIFYRMYISDFGGTGGITNDSLRNEVNPALASHYNIIDPYTTNDTVSPNAIASVFNNLKYYQLSLSNSATEIHLYQLLSSHQTLSVTPPWSSWSPVIEDIDANDIVYLDFTDTLVGPFMTVRYLPNPPDTDPTRRFLLLRAQERFSPLPTDRLFYNTDDLTRDVNLNSNINADVERKTSTNANPIRVYVSMYILATGIDNNYTLVYSKPKHIGIFELP